jgi:hypothetical protein
MSTRSPGRLAGREHRAAQVAADAERRGRGGGSTRGPSWCWRRQLGLPRASAYNRPRTDRVACAASAPPRAATSIRVQAPQRTLSKDTLAEQ